ncbi:glycoside hydrolase family 15 protein [Nocardioides sp. YIM 152315]|uniref:glycoside hydrolase family 15 protein n=1 Tax=Nocardioides sp. YIM 152315 TaxID=3031760 RepID=UPI0023DCCDDD|nr:glycoside hydrolase family 15 protein [Nocardioides sp. YIM 152315]MDF1601943.1 glycoside hydrolase family 15 protein [Nocardioides sp. YIM 152315]
MGDDPVGGDGLRFPPETLRQYALVADGERGALIGPRGDVAFLCAPRWHDDAVFSNLLGGRGSYAVQPADPRMVWGGSYEPGTLIWRSRWVVGGSVVECRDALAFPGDPERLVLLRRIEAVRGDAAVRVHLACHGGFGTERMDLRPEGPDLWSGRTGALHLRWTGAPVSAARDVADGSLELALDVPAGGSHELVLEIAGRPLDEDPPDPARTWDATARAWDSAVRPDVGSLAPRDATHARVVLRGLTSRSGAMVAAATTSLPERAEQGRDYDYRFAWIRDQCLTGQAAARAADDPLLACAVDFVGARLREDGGRLTPAYTVDGEPVPDQRGLDLPGYPGAPEVRAGNRVREQFQLDAFGEALLLFAAADRRDVLDADGWRAAETAAAAILRRQAEADAGIWELDPQRWAHSRLTCAAGLRAMSARRGDLASWEQLAERLVAEVERDSRHPSGRWQRSPTDPGVDAALLLPALRGAVRADDPAYVATWQAVRDELTEDGYVYRFRQSPGPLHADEGAFLLCGFVLAMATHQQGDPVEAVRWFERSRAAVGPPGLFTEEFDVEQRQLRGNLPQAFVHGAFLEAAHALTEDPDPRRTT